MDGRVRKFIEEKESVFLHPRWCLKSTTDGGAVELEQIERYVVPSPYSVLVLPVTVPAVGVRKICYFVFKISLRHNAISYISSFYKRGFLCSTTGLSLRV